MSGNNRKVAHLKHFSSEGIVCHVVEGMFNGRFVTEFIHNGNGSVGDSEGVDIEFKGSSGTFLLQVKSSDTCAAKFYLAQKRLKMRRENGNGGSGDLPVHILVVRPGTTVENVSHGLFCLTSSKRKRGGCQKCRERCIVFRWFLYLDRKKKRRSLKKGIMTRTLLSRERRGGLLY